jgi:putative toxin-antitoxin system antitoxin component (TIGR02293 family)
VSETERVVAILGGGQALGRTAPKTEFDLIALVRKGVPYRALASAKAALEVSNDDLSRYLRLKKRTLARRRGEQRLTADESERLVRLARVAARAEEVLGDRAAALRWIRKPNRALGGGVPIELLDTDLGLDAVLNILGRIEHGVYS